MSRRATLHAFTIAIALAACKPAASADGGASVPALTMADTSGGHTALPADLAKSKLTVLVFYAEHCPCFRVHDARIQELQKSYGDKGVSFLVVDSEVGASLERDTEAAKARNLPPIAIDPGAKLADALGAEYATYTVVLDGEGHVRYRGGIDSDKNRLTDDRKEYLREAIDDLLAGHEPRTKEGKALGCALQTR